MEDIEREVFEYCTLCNAMYKLNGRKQHLKTKKHRDQLEKNNLISNDEIPIERYTLKTNGVIELD
jgi:hypothetical protein